jgi:DNA gyrase/topoisomerase IV subunit B
MVFMGGFGGATNYLNQKKKKNSKILSTIITGILGAVTIPMILQVISSDMLAWIDADKFDSMQYLVFLGFCGVGGFSANAILPALSQRLVKQIQDLSDAHDNTQTRTSAIENAITEKDTPTNALRGAPTELSPDETTILNSINNSKYYFRTLNGLATDTGLATDALQTDLDDMVKKGVLNTKQSDDGVTVWYAV